MEQGETSCRGAVLITESNPCTDLLPRHVRACCVTVRVSPVFVSPGESCIRFLTHLLAQRQRPLPSTTPAHDLPSPPPTPPPSLARPAMHLLIGNMGKQLHVTCSKPLATSREIRTATSPQRPCFLVPVPRLHAATHAKVHFVTTDLAYRPVERKLIVYVYGLCTPVPATASLHRCKGARKGTTHALSRMQAQPTFVPAPIWET